VSSGLSVWVAEPSGETVGKDGGLPLKVTVVKADGGAVPTSVPWSIGGVAQGTLGLTQGGYNGSFHAGAMGGTYEVVVGWADGGGPTDGGSYTVAVSVKVVVG
jgi:hypothetical protein